MKKIFFTLLFSGILGLILSFFLVNTSLAVAPSAPQLLSPANGATVDTTPTLRWSNVGAQWYHLYFNENVRSSLTSTSYTFGTEEALYPGTTYQWSVRACNPGPQCSDSDTRSFTAEAAGDNPPTVSVEANPSTVEVGETVQVTVKGTDDYHLSTLYFNYGDGSSQDTCSRTTGLTWSCTRSHIYSEPRTYTINGRAEDNIGQHSDAQTRVTVTKKEEVSTPGPTPSSGSWTTIENPLNTTSFKGLIDALTDFIFKIGLALAPVMLIIAGFMFVTSGGSPERVNTAKKLALYTLIGLAVILLAKGLIAVLKSILGVKETTFLPLYFLGLAEFYSFKHYKGR